MEPSLMVPSEEFLRHAAECKSMARFTHDPENRAAWREMAERWVRCAELASRYNLHPLNGPKGRLHRKPAHSWSH